MKKHTRMVRCICCIMVFIFVCGAILPACSAQNNIFILQTNEEKMLLESPVNNAKKINYENESFFDYALIWGSFEHKAYSSLFRDVSVYNPDPWKNRTMNVIGYQGWEHKWTVKKAFHVKCNVLHLGFVGRNWLCVIGIRDVTAF